VRRLGDLQLRFAYGEGKVGDQDALVVVTEDESGQDESGQSKLTIRVRPTNGTTK
jgi:hypothetical protein